MLIFAHDKLTKPGGGNTPRVWGEGLIACVRKVWSTGPCFNFTAGLEPTSSPVPPPQEELPSLPLIRQGMLNLLKAQSSGSSLLRLVLLKDLILLGK